MPFEAFFSSRMKVKVTSEGHSPYIYAWILKYSRLSLSRTSRDSLKYIEIPVLRDIRFPEQN